MSVESAVPRPAFMSLERERGLLHLGAGRGARATEDARSLSPHSTRSPPSARSLSNQSGVASGRGDVYWQRLIRGGSRSPAPPPCTKDTVPGSAKVRFQESSVEAAVYSAMSSVWVEVQRMKVDQQTCLDRLAYEMRQLVQQGTDEMMSHVWHRLGAVEDREAQRKSVVDALEVEVRRLKRSMVDLPGAPEIWGQKVSKMIIDEREERMKESAGIFSALETISLQVHKSLVQDNMPLRTQVAAGEKAAQELFKSLNHKIECESAARCASFVELRKSCSQELAEERKAVKQLVEETLHGWLLRAGVSEFVPAK